MKGKLTKLIAVVMILAVMSGCAQSSTNKTAGDVSSDDAGNSRARSQRLVMNTGAEPESFDPASDTTIGNITRQLYEGLMTWDEGGLTEGTAEKVDISEDGLVYTVKIRDDARWSDGKDVTADDYAYSFLRVLNPENAYKFVQDSYYIKNGRSYNEGKVSADEVGIKVVDNKTLVITLENPTAYFLQMLATNNYYPVRKDVVTKDAKCFTNPEVAVTNGPFKLTRHAPNDKMIVTKNDYYYDKDKVKLDEIEFKFITDSQAELMAYKTNEIQLGCFPPVESEEQLKESGDLRLSNQLSIWWLVINVEKPVVSDVRVRRALAMAIDRKSLVENVTNGGEIPAYGLCSPNVMDYGANKPFREVYPEYFTEDVEEAKMLMAEAGYPDGKSFPEIVYATSNGGIHPKVAQAIQAMWKENLGIEVRIESMESQVFLSERKKGTYEISRYMWSGSFSDPNMWLELYLTDGANNEANYSNPEYDKLIYAAAAEVDVKKRFELLHDAEKLLIEDMPVIPLLYPMNRHIMKQNIDGVAYFPNGSINLKGVYFK